MKPATSALLLILVIREAFRHAAAMRILLITTIALLAGCAHRTTPPSVEVIKAGLHKAGEASGQTSRKVSEIKVGTDRISYKATRALEYFP